MGARDRNFYFNLVCRYGYEDAAHKIQDLYLAGRKAEAAANGSKGGRNGIGRLF